MKLTIYEYFMPIQRPFGQNDIIILVLILCKINSLTPLGSLSLPPYMTVIAYKVMCINDKYSVYIDIRGTLLNIGTVGDIP